MSKSATLRVCLLLMLSLIHQFTLAASSTPKEPTALRIAVSANFKQTLASLLDQYPFPVQLIAGSTGQLYAQITQGAPFDVFLAADSHRPQMLVQHQLADKHFIYANGKLVFWQPEAQQPPNAHQLITNQTMIAIANPKTAPYGLAAQQTIQHFNIQPKKLIRTGNVSQAYQHVLTGNVEGAFIAASLLPDNVNSAVLWHVPTDIYSAIIQEGVILNRTSNKQQAEHFVRFLLSEKTQQLIQAAGYLAIKQPVNITHD